MSDQDNVQDKYLFPGQSCYPLTPCQKSKNNSESEMKIVSADDQLVKIIQVLGPLTDEDTRFVHNENVESYLKQVNEQAMEL